MTAERSEPHLHRLTTPHTAAAVGIVFAVLFTASIVLIRQAIPADPFGTTEWLEAGRSRLTVALTLSQFACIAFLWFIGVLRHRLGDLEDQFFSTVFVGSGLLFLALILVTMASAGGLLLTDQAEAVPAQESAAFAHALILQISNVYSIRMAAVFMISLGTIWMRTGLMPRWLVAPTYLIALILLFAVTEALWLTLVFPAWVAVISLFLLTHARQAFPPRRTIRPRT
ncbi:hypothetical protein [Rhodococcus indonesiensis]